MHLLYLDESGNENDPTDRYFVLGGICLFERQTFHLTQAIERVQERHFPKIILRFHSMLVRFGLAETSGGRLIRKFEPRFSKT